MDTTELEAAYRSFLDTARRAGFKPPTDRAEWGAEQVLAHMAANDRLLAATTASVLEGEPLPYDNSPSNSGAYLEAIARAAGDWDGLVAEVRRCGLELVGLARQLDDEHEKAAVPTRIVDGGEVRVDAPMPWVGVLRTQAQVHVPSHEQQLRSLRG